MYDYHSHSSFSDDSTTPLYDMIHSAIEKGILELAVTDHYDPDYPDKNFPFELDFPGYHSALLQAEEEFARQIKIVKGIEIGIQHGALSAFEYNITSFADKVADHSSGIFDMVSQSFCIGRIFLENGLDIQR